MPVSPYVPLSAQVFSTKYQYLASQGLRRASIAAKGCRQLATLILQDKQATCRV